MDISIKNLSKNFNKNNIIKDISFDINSGETIGLIGDNGAGKTTLIKLILGEYKLSSGTILVNGEKIRLNDHKKISFFPDQNSFPRDITINNYFGFYLNLKGISIDKEYRDLLLEEFELDGVLHKKINELSSGMIKKMLMIAVLMADSELIIFDEPTANLDINSRNQFIEIFSYFKSKGKTLLITTHLVSDLEKIISRLMIIKEGEIFYNELFDEKDNIESIYKETYKDKARTSIIEKLK